MPLAHKQLLKLLDTISTTVQDQLDCDSCFELLADLAEAELLSTDVTEELRRVETHLRQCPCCKDEYAALLTGLRSLL